MLNPFVSGNPSAQPKLVWSELAWVAHLNMVDSIVKYISDSLTVAIH